MNDKVIEEISYSLNNIAGEMEGFSTNQTTLKEYYKDITDSLSAIDVELSNLNVNMEKLITVLKAIAYK